MRLRSRLLLAQAPLLLALVVSGIAGAMALDALGASAQHILRDNYRSVLAAERMREALGEMDRASLLRVAGHTERALEEERRARERFDMELGVAEGNVTEPGEREVVLRVRESFGRYVAELERARTEPGRNTGASYLERLYPALAAAKRETDSVLALNQDAMVAKSDRAEVLATRLRVAIALTALAGCLLGFLVSSALTSRLLRPLSVLAQATRRLGEGDLAARARIGGADEVGALASEFNTMADRLQQYRESSLGELLEAQLAFQAAIDSLPDPVIVIAVAGHILHHNEAADALLGAPAGEPTSLVTAPVAVREAVERVRLHVIGGKGAFTPKGLDEAIRVRTAEGERSLLPRATPVYGERGAVVATTVVLQDVTRLRRAGELKDDMVATVAHELRSPLTSLRMAIHLLLEQAAGPLGEKQLDLAYAAREDCERIAATIDELLDLSRIRSGRLDLRLADVGVDEAVRHAIFAHAAAAEARGVTLAARVAAGAGVVRADTERIALVLGNLLENAIRYSPSGATVVVAARRAGDTVRFEVVDRGPGVAAEHRARIFEKHERVPGDEAAGTGLGLFLAHEIVAAHGGEIGVEEGDTRAASGAGTEHPGSVFWFTLPAVAGEPRTA